MKWTELHELKVLVVYKKIRQNENRAKLIKELSEDKFFSKHGDKTGSILRKLGNIQYLVEGTGKLWKASKLNKKIIKEYKDKSIQELEQIIREKKDLKI